MNMSFQNGHSSAASTLLIPGFPPDVITHSASRASVRSNTDDGSGSGLQWAIRFISKVLDGVRVRALCRQVHSKPGKPISSQAFVHNVMLKQEKAQTPLHSEALPFTKECCVHIVAICGEECPPTFGHISYPTWYDGVLLPAIKGQYDHAKRVQWPKCLNQVTENRVTHPSSTPSIATVHKKNTHISRFAESSGNIIYMVS